jgi:hypothetical protein
VWARISIVVLIVVAHLAMGRSSEPFYNVDETRNVMTGVFFRDLAVDLPIHHPVNYTVHYYLQYPALGLLLWPPFFHVVLGAFMVFLGTSMVVAKGVVLLFSLLSCDFCFRLVRHTHDASTALVAAAVLGVSPLMFELSSQVMLEVPTLASVIAAVYYFVLYLDLGRCRHVYFACLAAALAVLTRFDGTQLGVTFLLLCLAKRRADVLWNKHFWLASLMALVLTLPVYALIFTQVGGVHSQNVSVGLNDDATAPFHPRNFLAYPLWVPAQMGWFVVIPAIVGLFVCFRSDERRSAVPYIAMFFSSYLMIVAVAEILERHAIYWGPPLALVGARGIWYLASRLGQSRAYACLALVVLVGTLATTAMTPVPYVIGYESAARYVVENTKSSRYCLFDRYMNGNFIYQIRRHDPERRIWVLRADKILYSSLIEARNDYRELVSNEQELLQTLDEYSPEFIILEEPQLGLPLPMAIKLRDTIHNHPEQFKLAASFPIQSHIPLFRDAFIHVYRNTSVRRASSRPLRFFSQTLGRSLGTNPDTSDVRGATGP